MICRTGQERRRNSPATMLYPTLNCHLVHYVFPMGREEVHPTIATSGRPPWPFPFLLPVPRERRAEVMRELERDWEAEVQRQIDPTPGSVMRALQHRAVWRWSNGWRRSRRTGRWLLMGDEPTNYELRNEIQVNKLKTES